MLLKKFKMGFFLALSITLSPPILATEKAEVNTLELLAQQLAKKKGDVIYVDFWASWCIPCRKSFPWMNNLKVKHQAQGLSIISINLDHDRELADLFLQENPPNFPVIYDPKGLIARKYKLKGMPSSFIVNRQGKIVSGHVGFNEEKKLAYEKEITALLNKSE
jgi:thiol-disulfide isomerase/thioredoxin